MNNFNLTHNSVGEQKCSYDYEEIYVKIITLIFFYIASNI